MTHDPLLGQLVDGHYQVHQLLGIGGMGRVYRAEQLELAREVALKTLPFAHVPDAEERRKRFQREAKATSRINHPGVVQIFGFGEWEGQLYIAMELIEGGSLAERLLHNGPLGDAAAAQAVIDACDAVHAAHAVGVLHRDLKPENIMLARGADGIERIKVVDFGLAIVMAATDQRLTQEGLVMGTPAYVSPEQARAELLDERSDVYSLGVVLFELLCGLPPFSGNTPADVVVKHCFEDPPLPSSMTPPGVTIHPSLESAALWALSKAPETRPQTAAAFAEELRAALALVEGGGRDLERTRKDPLQVGDRAARAAAAGLHRKSNAPTARPIPIAPPIGGSASSEAVRPIILVCEPAGAGLTVALRANQCAARATTSLQALPDLAAELRAQVAVVDLRPDPDALLAQLARPELAALTIITVGPDGEMALMTRALEQGIADYVPASLASSKLAKRVSKLLKRLEARAAHETST
ncbi:MAG: hypothetical protein CSB49_01105 [Proteobacteria bacterium]|nr:MAG: hypothetical protein CSB49_01105 [Pseudomonadota bacterium]